MNPTRHLWLAVINKALEDHRDGKLDGGTEYFHKKDFQVICRLADVDPQEVIKANGL